MPDPDPTSAQIGVTIRRLRKRRDLTIEELAHAAGIDVSYLSDIELKKRNPSWDMLRSIARPLEMTAVELVGLAAKDASKQRQGDAEDPPKP